MIEYTYDEGLFNCKEIPAPPAGSSVRSSTAGGFMIDTYDTAVDCKCAVMRAGGIIAGMEVPLLCQDMTAEEASDALDQLLRAVS